MFCVAYYGGSKTWLGTRSAVLTEKHTHKGMSHLVSEAGQLRAAGRVWAAAGREHSGAGKGRRDTRGLGGPRSPSSSPCLSLLCLL